MKKIVAILLVLHSFLLLDYIIQLLLTRQFLSDYLFTTKFLVILILMLITIIVIFKIDKKRSKWIFIGIFFITYFIQKFFNHVGNTTIISVPYILFYIFEVTGITFCIYYLFYKTE